MPDGVVSSDIVATTLENHGRTMVKNLPRRSPALAWIARSKRSTTGGFSGKWFRQPLEYGFNTNVQFYSGSEQFRVDRTDAFDSANFYLRQLVGTVVIEGIEEAMNAGREAAINFTASKIRNLERSLQMINAESFHFDGTEFDGKGFTGISAMVKDDPTVGSVGGITHDVTDQRGRNWWRSQVIKIDELPAISAGQAVVRDHTRAMNRLKIACADGADIPDMTLKGDDHYILFLEEIQEKVMLTDTKRGGVGFTNIMYMPVGNQPIINDSVMDVDRTYMLNTEYLYQRKAKGKWMTSLTPSRPVNQDVMAKSIIGYGNLTIGNLERQGVMLDT